MRDFYDVATLYEQYQNKINYNSLSLAFEKTCKNRKTEDLLFSSGDIIKSILEDNSLQRLWKQYCIKYKYAQHTEFSYIIKTLEMLITEIKLCK